MGATAVIGVFAAAASVAQAPLAAVIVPPPSLEAAAQALQSGDATTAARLLQTLTRQPGASARAWRLLGSACQQLHDNRRAINA